MTLKLNPTELDVLLQSLNAVGWEALPKDHPERRAAASIKAKLAALKEPADAAL